MQSSVQEISATKKRIIIEATGAELEAEIQKELTTVRSRTRIPGFRQGKAPMSIIEKKFGKEVEKDVLDKLVPQYYFTVVRENGLKPIGNPVFEENHYKRKDDLRLVMSVEVRPHVEGLVYEGLTVKDIPIKVEDDEIDKFMARLLRQRATSEYVDRPVEYDDLAILDITALDGGIELLDEYVRVGSDEFPKEFFDNLYGKSKNDSIDMTVAFPEGFRKEGLAGKTMNLKVFIKGIKGLLIPKPDDEFAKELGAENLEDLRKKIGEKIESYKKDGVIKTQKGELIKSLVEKYDFEIPEGHLNSELDVLVKNARSLPEFKDKSDDEIRERYRGEAVSTVKAAVLLDIIGEEAKVVVEDKELEAMLIRQAESLSMTPEALVQFYVSRDGSIEGLRYTIYREKVVDIIYSKANIEKEQSI